MRILFIDINLKLPILLFLLIAGIGNALLADPGKTQDTAMKAWIAEVSRPGFRLLAQKALSDRLVALFMTPQGDIALCQKVFVENKDVQAEIDIVDKAGNSVIDTSRDSPWLTRETHAVVGQNLTTNGEILDGEILPIMKGSSGKVLFTLLEGLPDHSGQRKTVWQTWTLLEPPISSEKSGASVSPGGQYLILREKGRIRLVS